MKKIKKVEDDSPSDVEMLQHIEDYIVNLKAENAKLRATIERTRELADDADCMDCSLSLHIRDVLDAVVHLENTNEGNDQ